MQGNPSATSDTSTDSDPQRRADIEAPAPMAPHRSAGIGGQECPACGKGRCACSWSAA